MSDSNRLSFERLADWIDGRLSVEEAAAVAAEVATADDRTRADVEWLRAFRQASERTVFADPPSGLRQMLVQQFNEGGQARNRRPFLRRLIAALQFDSNSLSPVPGLRAAGALDTQRQLIYSSEMADVALNFQPRPKVSSLDILGQVLPSADGEAGHVVIQLLKDDVEWGMTNTDELGEFVFEGVPAGTYELIVNADQFEIVIAPLELRL